MAKKPRTCTDCGNNPTNHTLSWVGNTTSIILSPLDRILIGNYFGKKIGQLVEWATTPYLWILRKLRLIHWNTDIDKALTERSKVVWHEAQKLGITMKQLVILKRPVEFYTAITPHGKRIYFESIPQTKKGYIESYGWMDDKILLKKKLRQSDIPTPNGGSAWNYTQALRIFNTIEKPVIIKPRIGSRGRHTTTFISTEDEFKKAFESAKKLCFFVVIEEHLYGSVYRATCVNGKVCGVLEGMPPRIIGNGYDTIEQRIVDKNTHRPDPKIKEVTIDTKLDEFLHRIGYDRNTILEDGVTIDLNEKIGLSYGGDSRELLPLTDPQIIQEIEKAARIIDAGVIGFDFICSDPTIHGNRVKWGIIECNSLPFINLHHDPRIGEPINVASFIWDAVA